jgi:drug/metabolite transporter (DMT)-like permease
VGNLIVTLPTTDVFVAMAYESTLIYAEPLLRKAVYCFWRRTVGAGFLFTVVILAILLVFLVLRGDNSWRVGALGSVLALGLAMAVAVYVIHYRNAFRKFRDMGEPQATFRAEESSFTMSSDVGTATFRWSAIQEVWQFPDVCLLLFSKAQFVTLPNACLPGEMREFILERVTAAGGKIR